MSPGAGVGQHGVLVVDSHVRETTTSGLNVFDKAATGPAIVGTPKTNNPEIIWILIWVARVYGQ